MIEADGTYTLREPAEAYANDFTDENEALSAENTILWKESVSDAST